MDGHTTRAISLDSWWTTKTQEKTRKLSKRIPQKLKKNLENSDTPLKTQAKPPLTYENNSRLQIHLVALPKTDPAGLTLDDFISKRPAFYPTSTTQSTRISGPMQKSTAARGVFVTDLNPGSRYDSIHSSQVFIAFKWPDWRKMATSMFSKIA